MDASPNTILIWAIAAAATAGVLVRPFKAPEGIWAMAGAGLLVVLGLIPLPAAGHAVMKGEDVYFFLIGMMLLSEIVRREGLFDWVAALAVAQARGSARRLFLLIYGVGVVVTALLSNDATAVVLTPAVFAATRRAGVAPMPYLLICAFVANAASFVLPISNPANLVLYGDHTPQLGRWLAAFALPSIVAIGATYAALRWTAAARLETECAAAIAPTPLSSGGRIALAALAATVLALLTASAFDQPLGLPTLAMAVLTLTAVSVRDRRALLAVRTLSWSVLPLVAGLFVIVEAVGRTGLTQLLAASLHEAATASVTSAAWSAGAILAVVSNLTNNLPAGLIASSTIAQAHAPQAVTDALLIGVDLGPNLSITGSLATILWLIAIRREGLDISFWRFARIGVIAMPAALILALAARLMLP